MNVEPEDQEGYPQAIRTEKEFAMINSSTYAIKTRNQLKKVKEVYKAGLAVRMAGANQDAKQSLEMFIQKKCNKPVHLKDISIKASKFGLKILIKDWPNLIGAAGWAIPCTSMLTAEFINDVVNNRKSLIPIGRLLPVVAPRRLTKKILFELFERFVDDDKILLQKFLPRIRDRITREYFLQCLNSLIVARIEFENADTYQSFIEMLLKLTQLDNNDGSNEKSDAAIFHDAFEKCAIQLYLPKEQPSVWEFRLAV